MTTACVERARETLERAGCEVLVFHATGNGGQAMESLIGEGLIAGVLDITTTELADEHVGGFLSAGPDRLTAAGKAGDPAGRVDRCARHGKLLRPRIGAREIQGPSLLQTQRERHADAHNAGRERAASVPSIAHKLAAAKGPVAILLPARGVSAIDKEGQPFDDPVARKALHDAIRSGVHGIEVTELDLHINDPEFADAAANKLLELMKMDSKQVAGGTS